MHLRLQDRRNLECQKYETGEPDENAHRDSAAAVARMSSAYRIALTLRASIFDFGLGAKLKPLK
jgi:hypothetical protein